MIRTCAVAALFAVSAAGVGHAQSASLPATVPGSLPAPSLVPRAAFFGGLGVSYNSARFTDQYLYAQGVSVIYDQNSELIGYGSASGYTDPDLGSDGRFAPVGQLGFYQHFGDSDWLWGAKFAYAYLDAGSSEGPLAVPQEGPFHNVSGEGTDGSFTGNVGVGSYATKLTHQLSLVPFLGHSFERGFIYAGAGPSLSRVETSLHNVVGFADINGVRYDITGLPDQFSSADWVWGVSAVVGFTYFIDASWFLDVSYSYGRTQESASEWSAPFSTTTRDGYSDLGVLSGNYSGRVETQALTVTLNRAF